MGFHSIPVYVTHETVLIFESPSYPWPLILEIDRPYLAVIASNASFRNMLNAKEPLNHISFIIEKHTREKYS